VTKKPTPKGWDSQANGLLRRQRPAKEEVLDGWIEDKLRSAYSSVLDEPIPEELIRLVQQKLKD
jgi:hypothetical protein